MSSRETPETKREKFVRLAERRVNSILEGLRKLGNLADSRNYQYSEEDTKKIFFALSKELNRTKKLFANHPNYKPSKFKL